MTLYKQVLYYNYNAMLPKGNVLHAIGEAIAEISPEGGVLMKKYEIMYILRAELSEEERNAEMEVLHKIITDLGGNIVSVDTENWGLRRVLHIQLMILLKGFYVVINIEAEVNAFQNLNGLAKFDKKRDSSSCYC